jgi:uncharacterized protein
VSLVASLQHSQGVKLEAQGVHTIGALAGLADDVAIPRLAAGTLAGLRQQADLQVRSRGLARPLHELHPPEHARGLARLPEPSDGDVFFDFEGDPFWGDEGLEYLFGTVFREDGEWRYHALWAQDRAQEKARFEQWMDWMTARLEAHPDLHVYHFNAYEPTALKRLMARHATREHELDELLRHKVFVDLYGIVRQALRAGVEGYGLKRLEPLFGFERDAAVKDAGGSLRSWQDYLDGGDATVLDAIAAYNAEDCRSTRALRDWLVAQRAAAEHRHGVTIAALEPTPPRPLSDKAIAYLERLEALRPRLTAGLPDDESEDDESQRAHRLAFDLLGYHRREAKPGWWEYFARLERSPEELRDEDSEAIGCLTPVAGAEPVDVNRSWLFTLQFPDHEYKLHAGPAVDPDGGHGTTIETMDEARRVLTVRRAKKRARSRLARSSPASRTGRTRKRQRSCASGSGPPTSASNRADRLTPPPTCCSRARRACGRALRR